MQHVNCLEREKRICRQRKKGFPSSLEKFRREQRCKGQRNGKFTIPLAKADTPWASALHPYMEALRCSVPIVSFCARFLSIAYKVKMSGHNHSLRFPRPCFWLAQCFSNKGWRKSWGKKIFLSISSQHGIWFPPFFCNECCPVLCMADCRCKDGVTVYFRDACKRRKLSKFNSDKGQASPPRMGARVGRDKEVEWMK